MIGGDGKMEEEKNVEGFGMERVYRNVVCIDGGEKMKEEIDFVGQIAKEEKLEPIDVRIRGHPYYMEEDEIGIMDILDSIWTYGQTTGGFVLNVEKTVPEFITIKKGYRPNAFSKYYYSIDSVLVTNGRTVFVSKLVDSDDNTHCDIYYKYKIIDATFAIVIQYEENNFNGEQRFLDVWVYGNNEKLVTVLRRLNDLLSP
jgi:hypothetical protein